MYGVYIANNCNQMGKDQGRRSQSPNRETANDDLPNYGQTQGNVFTTWWVPIATGRVGPTAEVWPEELNDGPLLKLPKYLAEAPNVEDLQRTDGSATSQSTEYTMRQGKTTTLVETTSGWPCLEDTDGQFLPNPLDTVDCPDTILPASDKHKHSLPDESEVVIKRSYVMGELQDEIWRRPIQNFPRQNTLSAEKRVLPDDCGCGMFGGGFRLITGEHTQQQSKQKRTGSQQTNSRESGAEMNSRSDSENSVAERTNADLRRVATLLNLRIQRQRL